MDKLATPAAGEVLIDVVAAGIGNWDELVRIGSWQIGGPAPMALGTEAAGTIAAVGSGVAELREGDEVMTHPLPLRRHGTWAGRLLAPAATVAARPPEASWEAGGAFPIPALTAAQALDRLLGSSGDWVVINGAGSTGGLLVQLAAAQGAGDRDRAGAKKAGPPARASEVLDYAATGLRSSARSPAARGRPSTLLGRGHHIEAVTDGGRLATIRATRQKEERGVVMANVYVGPMVGNFRRCGTRQTAPSACRSRPSVVRSGGRSAAGGRRERTARSSLLKPRWPLTSVSTRRRCRRDRLQYRDAPIVVEHDHRLAPCALRRRSSVVDVGV